MTYTKKIFRKATIIPVLLTIGFMFTTLNKVGNRKIIEIDSFASECNSDGSTPGMCGDISKNN